VVGKKILDKEGGVLDWRSKWEEKSLVEGIGRCYDDLF